MLPGGGALGEHEVMPRWQSLLDDEGELGEIALPVPDEPLLRGRAEERGERGPAFGPGGAPGAPPAPLRRPRRVGKRLDRRLGRPGERFDPAEPEGLQQPERGGALARRERLARRHSRRAFRRLGEQLGDAAEVGEHRRVDDERDLRGGEERVGAQVGEDLREPLRAADHLDLAAALRRQRAGEPFGERLGEDAIATDEIDRLGRGGEEGIEIGRTAHTRASGTRPAPVAAGPRLRRLPAGPFRADPGSPRTGTPTAGSGDGAPGSRGRSGRSGRTCPARSARERPRSGADASARRRRWRRRARACRRCSRDRRCPRSARRSPPARAGSRCDTPRASPRAARTGSPGRPPDRA
ncbi:MAG: hypothetical protein BWX64_02775 [Acidobacteria bacterium ADurb.Bin051]|nr:MAG: hypothetical protein BWX64_02775 [Acidobacteria bacterium ADurb.Bin051]